VVGLQADPASGGNRCWIHRCDLMPDGLQADFAVRLPLPLGVLTDVQVPFGVSL
jgi:hypothetical protein